MFLGDSAERGKTSAAGIGKDNIKMVFLFLDGGIEAIQVGQVGNIALYSEHVLSQSFDGGIEFGLSPTSNDDFCSFAKKAFGGGKAETSGSAGDQSDFSV